MALLYPAGQQFLDSNGDPVGAGNLYVYSNGTTSEASIYSNPALSTSLSNPVVLDSSGRSTTNIYVTDDTSYTVTLNSSASAELWSRDDVFGWSVSNVQMKSKASDQSVTSSTSLAADDDLTSFTLELGESYALESCLYFSASADGPGILLDFESSQDFGDESSIVVFGSDQDSATASEILSATTSDDNTTNFSSTGFDDSRNPTLMMHGVVHGNASLASTLQLRWAQASSSATSLTLKAGSWVRLTKL